MSVRPFSKVLEYLHRAVGVADTGQFTDGQLLERFTTGNDGKAFEALIERHGPLVWGVCRRLLSNRHDAEDAFQATFLVLVRKPRSFQQRSSLATWLYGIAYRVALKARQAADRRQQRERQAADMARSTVHDDSHWEEVRSVLDAELHRLPEKYREPLILCYLEGKTNEQAAHELGAPLGSMSRKLARGRELLRERLEGRGITLSATAVAAVLVPNASAIPPRALVESTATVAAIVAGKGTAIGAAAGQVAQLTEATVRGLAVGKLKTIAVAAAVLATATVGTLVLLGQDFRLPRQSARQDPAPVADQLVPQGIKSQLTPESFAHFHALVGPQEHEWRHLRVHWLTDIVAARRQAAAEDKPLAILHASLRPYTDPLGVCESHLTGHLAAHSATYTDEVIALLNNRFVCFAPGRFTNNNDEVYQDASQRITRKQYRMGEGKGALPGANLRLMTSAGRLLASSVARKQDVADALREVLAEYGELPEAKRRSEAVVGEERPQPAPPAGGLVLTIYDRPLREDQPDDGLVQSPQGQRNALWLTAEECRSLIPVDLREWQTHTVPSKLAQRLWLYGLVPNSFWVAEKSWQPDAVRESTLQLTVEQVTPQTVCMRVHGNVLLASAPTTITENRYDARLEGVLNYDREKKQIVRWDMTALGGYTGEWYSGDKHTGHRDARWMLAAPEAPLALGFAFELDAGAYDLPPERRRGRSYMHTYYFTDKEERYWDPEKWLAFWQRTGRMR